MPNRRNPRHGLSIKTVVVDLGGSHLRWEAFSPAGIPQEAGIGPTVPPDQLARRLKILFQSKKWGTPPQLLVGSKGVWTKTERKELTNSLRGLAEDIHVLSDVELGYWSVPNRPPTGIHVVVGTGSIALARDSHGRWHRSGGAGPQRGDEGSGFWLGRELLCRKNLISKEMAEESAKSAHWVTATAAQARAVLHRPNFPPHAALIREAQTHIANLVMGLEKAFPPGKRVAVSGGGSVFLHPRFNQGLRKLLVQRAPGRFRFLPPSPHPLAEAGRRWKWIAQGRSDRWPPRAGARKYKRPSSQNPTA